MYGPSPIYIATMTSANSLVAFDVTRAWDKVYFQVPTMTSAANFDVYASIDGGTTYYQVRQAAPNTATVAAASYVVSAGVAANGGIIPLPAGFRYYQLKADSAPTAATTFRLICGS